MKIVFVFFLINDSRDTILDLRPTTLFFIKEPFFIPIFLELVNLNYVPISFYYRHGDSFSEIAKFEVLTLWLNSSPTRWTFPLFLLYRANPLNVLSAADCKFYPAGILNFKCFYPTIFFFSSLLFESKSKLLRFIGLIDYLLNFQNYCNLIVFYSFFQPYLQHISSII